MTSNGVMVIATATPLIVAAIKAVSQLLALFHCRSKTKQFNSGFDFELMMWRQLLVSRGGKESAACHVYLRMWHPVLSRGEGCQLSSWSDHDSRHSPVHTPPKAKYTLSSIDGKKGIRHSLKWKKTKTMVSNQQETTFNTVCFTICGRRVISCWFVICYCFHSHTFLRCTQRGQADILALANGLPNNKLGGKCI